MLDPAQVGPTLSSEMLRVKKIQKKLPLTIKQNQLFHLHQHFHKANTKHNLCVETKLKEEVALLKSNTVCRQSRLSLFREWEDSYGLKIVTHAHVGSANLAERSVTSRLRGLVQSAACLREITSCSVWLHEKVMQRFLNEGEDVSLLLKRDSILVAQNPAIPRPLRPTTYTPLSLYASVMPGFMIISPYTSVPSSYTYAGRHAKW